MYRFKLIYLILIIFFIVILISGLLLPGFLLKETIFMGLSFIISISSVIIAIAAIMLVDKKEIQANISAELSGSRAQNGYNLIIKNKSKEGLQNPVVYIRLPQKLLFGQEQNNEYGCHKFGESTIIALDFLKYFPNTADENVFVVPLALEMSEWKKGNIWLTVNADNVNQTTLKLSHFNVNGIFE